MARLVEYNPMSVSVVAKGDNNAARAYWLEPTAAPAPPPPTYVYPAYQYSPVPMAGGRWDYG
eukprot:9476718-Lingulodinium_polyedra.AAC.1